MKFSKILFRLLFCSILICALAAFSKTAAQKNTKTAANKPAITGTTVTISNPTTSKIAETGAFAEVYAAKVEAEADLKVLTMEYPEGTQQVLEKKFERDLLNRQIRWLEALPSSSYSKMTTALGRLLVRKTQAEAAVKTLSENYADQHPALKKAQMRIEIFNSEIQKLLQ